MSKLELGSRIMRWDTSRWRNKWESKTTLAVYYQHKREIGAEKVYVHDYGSVMLYRCRSNTLWLDWRNRFAGGGPGGVECRLCGGTEVETLEHFLQECDDLREVGGMGGGVPWASYCCLGWRMRRTRTSIEASLLLLLKKIGNARSGEGDFVFNY